MTPKIFSTVYVGFDGKLIEVGCDTSNDLPGIVIVGLINKDIDEAKERIRSSVRNSGLSMPRKRITLNLTPADLPKDGSSYDVPTAIAVVVSSKQVRTPVVHNSFFSVCFLLMLSFNQFEM